ncbi:MAG TPA: biotin/lipoyl-binding protein [Hydrogenothermaceae bacterium]|nr:biotin/lipoyl-binding protein [Hydrogenothermaceae bacterium]
MYKYNVLKRVEPGSFVGRYILITIAIFIVIMALLWLPWQQTVKGVGTVTALNPDERNYKIVSTIDGFIESVDVKENQYVQKGDKLFSMKDLDASYQEKLSRIVQEYRNTLHNAKERYKNLEDNFKQQKKSMEMGIEVYDTKLIQLQNKVKALNQQQKALRNQSAIEKINYKRAKRLFKDGIESKRGLELKKFHTLKTEAAAEKITVDLENMYNELNITQKEKMRFMNESELKLNDIQNKKLSTQSSINTLQQEIDKSSVILSRYLSKEIVAKSDGHIMRIYQAEQNILLKKGEEVMYFSPKVTERAILLKVPIFNMPLIKKGLKVRIIFYGWPALNISGWPHISHGTYGGTIKSIERASHEKGVYYALVVEDPEDDPWPDSEHLRIGTEATLWIRLKTVHIWYELWRLLAAQPPKMVNMQENVQ